MQRIIHAPKQETCNFEELCLKLNDDIYRPFFRRLNQAKIILFDMDGTIVNAEPIWSRIHQEVARELNLDVTAKQLEKLVGLALLANRDLVAHIIKQSDPDPFINRVIERGNQIDWYREIELVAGVRPVIDKFDAANKPRAIVTSSENSKASMYFEKFKIDVLFTDCYGRDRTMLVKPHPGAYQYALKDLGILPEHAIAIEDTLHGLESSINAGLYSIYVPSSDSALAPTDKIIKSAAKHNVVILCVASHHELLQILDYCLSPVPRYQRDIEWF